MPELQYVALAHGVVLAQFSSGLLWNPQGDPKLATLDLDFTDKFEKALHSFDGILVGEINGNAHAVAFSKGLIYDSNGTTYPYAGSAFVADDYYAAIRVSG